MTSYPLAEPVVPLEMLFGLGKLDPHKRFQSNLKTKDVFPIRMDKLCACGCGRTRPGLRRRWATEDCNARALRTMHVLHADGPTIGYYLEDLHGSQCAECEGSGPFDVDHIIEVADGGGGRWLDNYQLLCHECHVKKTAASRRLRAFQKSHANQVALNLG